MPATNYTQPTRTAENKSMTTTPPVTGIPRQILTGGAFTLLVAALLLALPASIEAQPKVLVLSKLSVEVTEEGTQSPINNTDTYMVGLNTQPTGPVTVTVASSDPKAAKVHTGLDVASDSIELSFNTQFGDASGNWNTSYTVTVTGQPDDIDNEGDGRFPTVTHTPMGGGFGTAKILFVVVHDDTDAASLDLPRSCPPADDIEQAAVSVNEEGTITYCVKLGAEPTGPVTVTATSDDISVAIVGPTSLTFTPKDWMSRQIVTVTGVDDDVDNPGDSRSATITHTASGGGYDAVAVGEVPITVNDMDSTDRSDTAGLTTTPATVSVSEAAGKAPYTVRLNTRPTDSVIVALASSNTRAATVSPASLTFTPSNWSKTQTVTVTGVDDDVDNPGDRRSETIEHTPRGGGYNAVELVNVMVTINDDGDKNGVTVSQTQIEVVESSRPPTYTVVLDAKPNSAATVTPTFTSTDFTTTPASGTSLTFTSDNWDQPQTVTIYFEDDTFVNPGRSVTITHNTGADYNGVTAPSVSVSIVDDDRAKVKVSTESVNLSEPSGNDTYDVWLENPPETGSVTINIETSGDTGAVTVDPADFELSGTTRQPVTVTGVNDDVDNPGGRRSVTIEHMVDETTGGYAGVTVPSVSVRVDDDDVSNLLVSPTSSVSISEAGGTTTRQVWLDPPETGPVTVNIETSGDTGAVTVDPANFELSGTTRQTVTVTGVNDDVDNPGGRRSVTLSFEPTDANKGFALPVTVRDDTDARGIKFTVLRDGEREEVSSLSEVGIYSVELKSRPSEDVVVKVTSNDPSLTVDTNTITFMGNETSWKTPVPVTLTVSDDLGKPSGAKDVLITHTANGGDYDGETNNLRVRVTKEAGEELLLVTPKLALTIEEGAPPIEYSVKLGAAPTLGKTVIVSVTSSSSAATVSPKSLTFTRANWSEPQVVAVASVPDFARANRTATITFTPRDGGYSSAQAERRKLTVADSTRPGLLVSPSSVEVSEGQRVTFAVELNTPPTVTVTVAAASDNTSVATVSPKVLTFTRANWDHSQRVTVTGVSDDKVNAANRTADIELEAIGGDYEGEKAEVQATVTDDDATVTVSASSVEVAEARGTARYTVKLDGQPTDNVTLTVTSSSSVATVRPGSLTFTPSNWATPQTITVTGVDDSSPGGNRSVTITHTASGGGYDEVEVPSVSVTVTDDDGMTVAPTKVEIAEAGGTATYRVSLNTQPTGAVTVAVASSNTSIATVNPTSLTFTTSNWASQPVTVTGVDDQVNNGAGRSATITNTPSGAGYGTDQAQRVDVWVEDDDPAPTLEIRGGEATEGPAGTTTLLTFTVTKSGPTDQVVTVAYADAGTAGTGTATAGTDYTAVAGSLTFELPETSKTITVMVQGDDLSEPDETVVIALRSPSNATIAEGKGTATGTIVDDDASRLSIEAGAARVDEGETLIFTVTLDPPIDDQQVTVEVDAGGTATAGTDYKGVPEMLTFVAGDAAKTITVAVEDDTDYELNETIVIALRNPRPLGDVVVIDEAGEAMVTIVDNDPQPMLSISGTSVAEGNDGTTSKLTFKVTKSGGTSMEATVAYADAGTGTATAGTDYTAVAAGTLTFAPNETSKTVTVVVKGDDETEGDETVVIRLSSPSKATIAEDKDTAAGTIIDDDTLPRVASDWLARFGRTAASDTLDAIARRMNDGVVAAAPSLTVAGHRATFAPEPIAQAAAGTAEPWEESRSRVLTLEELANGSSAEISFVDGLNVWGASGYNQFEMTPQGSYTMDGSLMSAILGVDHQGDGYVAGLALAYHGGAGDFSGIGKTEGSLGTNLYSVHPYARLTFGEAFHVGGSFGIGTGDLSITDKDGDALVETGVGMPVLAALDARLELSLAEAWILALQADGHFVQMVADERLPRFTRVETSTHRLRLGVENSYVFLVTDGVSLAPVLETGLRYDGGDVGETGLGFDIGGGLRLDATVVGLMVDARGHASLSNWGEGQEQAPMLRDWGLGGVIRWRPAGGGTGPEISLSPSYGGTLGAAAPSLNAEIGYRMAAFGGVFTPYSAAEFGNGHQSYRAGAHFEIGQGIALSAEGTHRQSAIGAGEQFLTLEMRLRQ